MIKKAWHNSIFTLCSLNFIYLNYKINAINFFINSAYFFVALEALPKIGSFLNTMTRFSA